MCVCVCPWKLLCDPMFALMFHMQWFWSLHGRESYIGWNVVELYDFNSFVLNPPTIKEKFDFA